MPVVNVFDESKQGRPIFRNPVEKRRDGFIAAHGREVFDVIGQFVGFDGFSKTLLPDFLLETASM